MVMRRGSVTDDHEPALKSCEDSSTKTLLVAGHAIASPFVVRKVKDNRGGRTWNKVVLVTLPCGVRMVMGLEMASGGTMAVMRRSKLLVAALVKLALAPLNSTLVAPVKLVPVSVTFAPGIPLAGENCEPVKPGGGVGYQVSLKLYAAFGSKLSDVLSTTTE